MGLNFRKSISLGHGLKINLSKGGPSLSFGKKGLRQTISASGRATTTVGIPGTGVYYSKQKNVKSLFGGLFGGDKKKGKEEKASKASKAEKEPKATATKASKPTVDIEGNKQKVAEYEAYIDSIRSVHKICDDSIDWQGLSTDGLPAGIKIGTEAYNEWKTLNELSLKVIEGDVDSYLAVISEMAPFDDLLEYGSGFEVGTEDPNEMSVEFQVKSDKVVPDYSLSLLASGEISEKPLSKSAYYDLVQDYVCSTAIRVARDTFALLPVKTCKVHAVDVVLNSATGNEEEVTILSVAIDRDKLAGINMDRIDPSDALEALGCRMSFKKTTGFGPVTRV